MFGIGSVIGGVGRDTPLVSPPHIVDSPPNLLDGLLAYWSFDGDNSNDALGVCNGLDTDMTYNSGNGKINDGAVFNGSTSYINIGTRAFLQTQVFTYAGWVKPANGVQQTLIGWGNSPTVGTDFGIESSNILRLIQQGVAAIGYSTGTVTPGIWNHIAVTYDALGNYVFYINGINAGSGNNLLSITYADNLWIGKQNTGLPLSGAADEIGIWGRPLSQNEITRLYNSGYPFGQSPHTTVAHLVFRNTNISGATLPIGNVISFVIDEAVIPGLFKGMRQDGGDIRVFGNHGSTAAYFYITNFSYANHTLTLWVRTTNPIGAGESDTYYLTCGNNYQLTSLSSFNNTFNIPAVNDNSQNTWNFNAGSGSTITDSGDQALNLTLTGSAVWNGTGTGPWGLNTTGEIPSAAKSLALNGSNKYLSETTNGIFKNSVPNGYAILIKLKTTAATSNGRILSNFTTDSRTSRDTGKSVPVNDISPFSKLPSNTFGKFQATKPTIRRVTPSGVEAMRVYNGFDLYITSTGQFNLDLHANTKTLTSPTMSLLSRRCAVAGSAYHIVYQAGAGNGDNIKDGSELWINGSMEVFDPRITVFNPGGQNPFMVGAKNVDGTIGNYCNISIESVQIINRKLSPDEIWSDFLYMNYMPGQYIMYNRANVRKTVILPSEAWEGGGMGEPRLLMANILGSGYPSIMYGAASTPHPSEGRYDWNGNNWIKASISGPIFGNGGSGYPSYAGCAVHGGIFKNPQGTYFYIFSDDPSTGSFQMTTSDDLNTFTYPVPFISSAAIGGAGGTNAGNCSAIFYDNLWYIGLEVLITDWTAYLYTALPDSKGNPDPNSLVYRGKQTSLSWNGTTFNACGNVKRLSSGQFVTLTFGCPAGTYKYQDGVTFVSNLPSLLIVKYSSDLLNWQDYPFNPVGNFTSGNTIYDGQDLPYQDQIADPNFMEVGNETFIISDCNTNKGTAISNGLTYVIFHGSMEQYLNGIREFNIGTLSAEAGIFTLSGQSVEFKRTYILPAETGVFSATGEPVILAEGHKLPVGSGSFSLSGQSVALVGTRKLSVGSGSFSLSGQNVSLIKGNTPKSLSVEAGLFSLNGEDVVLIRWNLQNYRLIVETGLFYSTGNVRLKRKRTFWKSIANYVT